MQSRSIGVQLELDADSLVCMCACERLCIHTLYDKYT